MIKSRPLGGTGTVVSELGFGAWPIGGTAGRTPNYGDVSEREAVTCVEAYLDGGGNHIDTARAYNDSERILGLVTAKPAVRDGLFIASKTVQNDAAGIRADLEESLRVLQTDRIDLYYMHMPPDDVDGMNRNVDAFERLREEGKIRFIGASIKGPNVTQATVDLCRQYIRAGRLDAIQLVYSILRQKTAEIFQEARKAGVGLVGRTSLESGFLTGKYRSGHAFTGQDHRRRWSAERLRAILECVDELARTAVAPRYETLARVAIRFAMAPTAISSTIVGATSAEQTRANVAAVDLPPLDEELIARFRTAFGDRTEEFNGDG